MRFFRWVEQGAIYIVIFMALAAGLAASYGRELEAKRRPDRQWLIRRLMIMPLLAIAATAATEAFGLTPSVAAFSAAMLSLGGYDALRLIETKWKARIAATARAAEVSEAQAGEGSNGLPPGR
jgi:hypothetical protein